MSERSRTVVAWAALAVLAVAGAYFALVYERADREPQREASQATFAEPTGRAARSTAARRGPQIRPHRRRRPGRRTKAASHPGRAEDRPRPRGGRPDQSRAQAKAVARRFLAAFAEYELGVLEARIAAELRATATARFARELIASPPRVANGRAREVSSALGDLVVVGGATDGRGALRTAELVGSLERRGERSPVAIELRTGAEGWRVAGIAR